MKQLKEIINQINNAKICSPHFLADEIDMTNIKEVATIDTDEHRWFIVGTVVFQYGDEFFGVYGPISLKSEDMGYDDVAFECEAFELEPVPSVTYERKK